MSTSVTPRIPPLPREEWTDAARDVFAYWEGPTARDNGSRSNTMMTLANHPRLALASLDMGKYMLVESSLTKRQKELVVLRVAWRYASAYQWAHHVHSGRQIGMTDAEFEALQQPGPSHVWSPADQALISAIDQLCDSGRIDHPTWAQLSASMDKHQLMDFLYSVGFFTMNAWAFGAMGVQLEPEFEAFSTPADQLVGGTGSSET
jgi:4-carboxymuconolactone decarboxylase